jgi:hypothetical protein
MTARPATMPWLGVFGRGEYPTARPRDRDRAAITSPSQRENYALGKYARDRGGVTCPNSKFQ